MQHIRYSFLISIATLILFCSSVFAMQEEPAYKKQKIATQESIEAYSWNLFSKTSVYTSHPIGRSYHRIQLFLFNEFRPVFDCDQVKVATILAGLETLVASKEVDVNDCGDTRYTPLMIAAARGSFEVCDFLLKQGADPHIFNDYGRCVLGETMCGFVMKMRRHEWGKEDDAAYLAHSLDSYTKVVRLLLKSMRPLSYAKRISPLHVAAHFGLPTFAALLLHHGICSSDKDLYNRSLKDFAQSFAIDTSTKLKLVAHREMLKNNPQILKVPFAEFEHVVQKYRDYNNFWRVYNKREDTYLDLLPAELWCETEKFLLEYPS